MGITNLLLLPVKKLQIQILHNKKNTIAVAK